MGKAKRRMAVLSLAVILTALFTQPSLAYYTTIGRATNVVTSGDIQLAIHERMGNGVFPENGVFVIPGDKVEKEVTIQNVCSHPFWLRVKLVKGSNSAEVSPEALQILDLNLEDWEVREDGYYYYKRALLPNETTAPLIKSVQIEGSLIDQHDVGTALTLTVKAEAVQSEHNAAVPWQASGWPQA